VLENYREVRGVRIREFFVDEVFGKLSH